MLTRDAFRDAWSGYTDEQWAGIERALQHLQASQVNLKEARERLGVAAARCRREIASAPRRQTQKRLLARDWTRITKLSDELIRLLSHVEVLEPRPADPEGRRPTEIWCDHKLALMKLNDLARSHFAAPKLDDGYGYPTASPRAWFQFTALELWTRLGGKLQFSRHARTNKIAGPLVRYFSAASLPVLGGSPESLPDILKRHKAMALAFNKARISQLAVDLSWRSDTPPTFADAMTRTAALGMGEWANQNEVQFC
jgi:hypothetical protein